MLTNNMNLAKMIAFSPSETDMAMLPLEAILYIKTTIISSDKEDNYNFIRYLFTHQEIKDYFHKYENSLFYDFDVKDKFITIFELYGLTRFAEMSLYLKELLKDAPSECDVVFNIYTHNDKKYRISLVDEMVSEEEVDE